MISWPLIPSLLAAAAPALDAGQVPALNQLAAAVLAQAQSGPVEGPVGVFIASDAPALDRAFGTVLIARISEANLAGVPIPASDFSGAEASARKLGTRSLLRLQLSVRDGRLSAAGDLISTWVNIWSGRVPTRSPRPAAVLQGSVPLDAEVLAFLAPKPSSPTSPPSPHFKAERVTTLAGPIAALAVGDIAGDGTTAVLALTENALIAMDLGGRLLGQMPAPEAPSPSPRLREPFGSLVILKQPARVACAWMNVARPVVLVFEAPTGTFRELESLGGGPVAYWNGQLLTAPLLPGHNAFGSTLSARGEILLDTRHSIQGGSTLSVPSDEWMLLAFSDGSAAVYRRSLRPGPAFQLGDLGAGTTLLSVFGGAVPQVATTSAAYHPSVEELRIWSLDQKALATTVALGPGKAWYLARVPRQSEMDQMLVGVLRPDGTTELVRVSLEP